MLMLQYVFLAISENHFSPLIENINVENNHPTRATIIERLLRFFRSRPSMDSLRERGIYRRKFKLSYIL